MAYVRNVERGDSLVLSSSEHNRIANAVNSSTSPSVVVDGRENVQYSFLELRNGTSSVISQYRFVSIRTTGSSTYIEPFDRVASGTPTNLSIGYTDENIEPNCYGRVIVSGVFQIYFCANSFGSVDYNESSGVKYAYAIDDTRYVISDGVSIGERYPGAAIVGKVITHNDKWSNEGNYGASTIDTVPVSMALENVLWGTIEKRLESGIYVVNAYGTDDVYLGQFYYAAVEMAAPTNIVIGSRVILHQKLAKIF